MLQSSSGIEQDVSKNEEAFENNSRNTFVGRDKQLNKLRGYLLNSRKGSGSFVVITGKEGMGKAHLLKHFAIEAHESGATFIMGNFQGVPSHDPYRPFWKMVQQLNQTTHNRLDSVTANQPSATDNTYNVESLYSLQTDHRLAQQRLIKALLEVARNKVLVIVLQNVHLAPLTTWQFIHFFSKSLMEKRLLLIATLTDNSLEAQNGTPFPYVDVLQRMNREGLYDNIQLSNFSEKETRQLLFTLLKRTDFSSRFTKNILKVSDGVPGRIIQLLQIMRRNRLIYEYEGIWFDQEGIDREMLLKLLSWENDLPVFEEFWQKFDHFQKTILEYVSLFENSVDHIVLANIMDKPRIKIIKALERLQQAEILRTVEEMNYQFKMPILATRVREQIPDSQRKVMHRQICAAIQANPELASEEKIPLLAYHYNKAGNAQEAFSYLMEAGSLAVKNFAFLNAKELFEQALAFSITDSQLFPEAQQIVIQLKLIWVCRMLGDREASLEYCTKALASWCDGRNPELRTQILIQMGFAYFQLNEWQKSQECLEACLVEHQDDKPFDQAMALYGLGNVHLEMSNYDLAENHYLNALSFAKKLDSKIIKANLFNNLGILENIRGNRIRAINLYNNCVPIYKELGDNSGLARIYNNIGISYSHENDWQQADNYYGKCLRVTDEMGLIPLKSIAFLNRVQALIALKKFDEAREYNTKAYRLVTRIKDQLGIAEYYKNQGIIERVSKNNVDARLHFEKALEMFSMLQNKLGIAETEDELGKLAFATNDREKTEFWFSRAKENYQKLGVTEKVQEMEDNLREKA